MTHFTTRSRSQEQLRWVVPPRLTRDAVESWLEALPAGLRDVTFHLGHEGCTSGPLGSETLQSAICQLQRSGVATHLSVPASTFQDTSRKQLFVGEDSAKGVHLDEGGTPAERTLAYKLPGLVLAQLCEAVDGTSQVDLVRELQAEAIARDGSLFGHGKYRALAVIGERDHRTQLRVREGDRQSILENKVLQLLGTASYHPSHGHPLMEELLEFVYQATENTFDHGRRDFSNQLIRQVRTVAVERHIIGSGAGAVEVDALFPEGSSPTRDYIERMRKRALARREDPERLRMLSVTVADGGVGIAARMHGGLDVYAGDLGHEFNLVQEAVLPEGTTKPIGQPGRGAGLVKMMRATHRLDGLFEIRSGRLALTRTYLDEDGSREPNLDFRHRHSSAFNVHGHDDEQVLLAGTVVSVLFPAFDLRPATPPARRHQGRA